ncbi:MAG: hypothetical protein KatS3mg105_4635 [Gemmatales bacterium]|nr:MAG: hypothetical protein KatS3mg105_4635 [Gemmatales bacterium]
MYLTYSEKRHGFTLIELLVVIAIMAAVAALTFGAAQRVISAQKYSATETTIRKLNRLLIQATKRVVDDARDEAIPDWVRKEAGNNPDRARVLWVKYRVKQEFPENFSEALNPVPLGPDPAYQTYLTGVSITNSADESSACLLMALTAKNRRGGEANADLLNSIESFIVDANGVKAVFDAWGNPLYFFRWPYGNDDLDRSYTATGPSRDPLDPTGSLQAPNWNRNAFTGRCHPIVNRYFVPVIVSAGPDGKLGLAPGSMAVTDPIAAADNLYSYQLLE